MFVPPSLSPHLLDDTLESRGRIREAELRLLPPVTFTWIKGRDGWMDVYSVFRETHRLCFPLTCRLSEREEVKKTSFLQFLCFYLQLFINETKRRRAASLLRSLPPWRRSCDRFDGHYPKNQSPMKTLAELRLHPTQKWLKLICIQELFWEKSSPLWEEQTEHLAQSTEKTGRCSHDPDVLLDPRTRWRSAAPASGWACCDSPPAFSQLSVTPTPTR